MATTHLTESDHPSTAGFGGVVVRPVDPDYDTVRAVWNGMFDRRPALILRCRSTDDVVAAISIARASGLEVAVRGGGHSLSGQSTTEGGILIDLSLMRRVEVDPATRIARAEPGATWRDYDAATHEHGLASTGGLISSTGVAGLTLGGGIGWLMRRHGLACDNLVAADVVTADGRRVRASGADDAELLWGLRGGGGNFGIVTSLEFRIHPVTDVLGGLTLFTLDRAREVLRRYRSWAAELPDEFTTLAAIIGAPPAPFVPAELVGRPVLAIAGAWSGDIDAGQAHLGPIRELRPFADVFGPMPYPVLQGMLEDGAPMGLRTYTRSGYLADLPDGLIDVLVEQGARLPSPLSQIHIHQLGGAVARVGEEETAFGQRRAAYAYNLLGTWPDAADDEPMTAAVRELADAIAPFASGRVYVNFLGTGDEDRVRLAYGERTYDRLARLKARYDPDNLFHRNHNIRPAAAP